MSYIIQEEIINRKEIIIADENYLININDKYTGSRGNVDMGYYNKITNFFHFSNPLKYLINIKDY